MVTRVMTSNHIDIYRSIKSLCVIGTKISLWSVLLQKQILRKREQICGYQSQGTVGERIGCR